ncbi:MAG: diguanylate cyclase [Gammaproteobacteria bacterium]|nr:diguanylate cyclase [Gammaproteobacteria bacterium]
MTANLQPTGDDKPVVLITDDSKVLRRAMSKMLEHDAELVEAENGEQAWNQVVSNPDIQVLITDIEMPVLDGYQLICRIRAHDDSRIRELPIITITGAEDEETKTRAFACGATDFIVKPLDKVQLQARVQAHARFDDTNRALAQSTAALQEEAANDPLTGLMSRKAFVQRAEQDIAHADRHGSPLSLMRIEIDRFKKLYQQYGDDGANRLLAGFSKLVRSAARAEDSVARIGGNEFALIAPATDHQAAIQLAQRIRSMVSSHSISLGVGDPAHITSSIGVVSHGNDGNNLASLLDKADHRLRDAKAEGGDHVCAAARDEEVVAAVTEEVTLDAAAPAEPKPVPPATTDADLVDINRAIELLAAGETSRISPYLLDLAIRVLPILEHCDREQQLGIAPALDAIRKRLLARK